MEEDEVEEKERSELLSGEKEWGKTFDALSDFLFYPG